MDIKRGAFQPLPQVTYSRPRYYLCTNLTLSALLASYISPTTHDSSYIGTMHQTKLVPRGRDPYVQRRGSLVTEALGTRLQWNQSQDCFSTHVTINYQFFFAHGKWVPITYFPIFDTIQYFFPRLWPFTQGVFPHLAPLDRLSGYMFSRAFYYCLTGYMSVFSRAFHQCLTGYLFSRTFLLDRLQVMRFSPSFIRLQVFPRFSSLPDWLHVFLRISPWFIRLHVFQRFSPLVNWLQVYPRFSPLLYWLHVFPRSLPTLVPFQVYPLFSALLDWLHAVLRFSPVSDHCLTGCVFLRFSPLLDPGSQISLACRANRASQNLKLSSLFFRTLKGYRENWGTVKALTFSRLRIVAICVSLANLSLIVHWVTAVK